jgi:hypothetical protein
MTKCIRPNTHNIDEMQKVVFLHKKSNIQSIDIQ